jgi:predicted nucleic acid-binding Zn ribbon protein
MVPPSPCQVAASKPLDTGLGGTVLGSPEAPDRCVVCGRPMRPRKGKMVCSSTCRWRRLQHRRRMEVRDGLLLVRAQLDDLLALVERRR